MNLEHVLASWVHDAARSASTKEGRDRPPLSGRWTNQQGSVLELTLDGSRVSGSFTAGGPSEPMSGPVTGWASNDIVAFSVRWPAATHSLTAWVGQLVDEDGAPVLKTLWHLVVDVPDAREDMALWATVHSGADTFR